MTIASFWRLAFPRESRYKENRNGRRRPVPAGSRPAWLPDYLGGSRLRSKPATNDRHLTRPAPGLGSKDEFLPAPRCLEVHRLMVRARAMEERMIKMSKSGEGFFWIGGPGEEAFNVCLGLQVKKGRGPDFDFLHLHYRNSATMVAMGMPLLEGVRQMAMTRTDTSSMGRNFSSHFAKAEWNVVPVCSVIGIQWVKAPGTALVQKRRQGDGVTIVVGGDAGTAEGDFASCLLWSTRPENPLPVLMVVMNNGWGISTSHATQHSCGNVIDRGKPFGIPGECVDGNDPVQSWFAIQRGLEHVRTTRTPYMLEARVSRLYGHSSSSGAPRSGDQDCIPLFEERLRAAKLIDDNTIEQIRDEARAEVEQAVAQAMREPKPQPEDVERHTYAPSPVDAVYPGDYNGLP
jgi:2-oxoisovalerate dehydrogenase E1 component alpha subunit